MDALDAKLVLHLLEDSRIGVLELSRRLGVARATVQSRIDKLVGAGVIESFDVRVNTAAMGYPVTAFVTLHVRKGFDEETTQHLISVPEVMELHTITGEGDLLCRIVSRSNSDLRRILEQIVTAPGLVRASTVIALTNDIPLRIKPLIAAQVTGPPGPTPRPAH